MFVESMKKGVPCGLETGSAVAILVFQGKLGRVQIPRSIEPKAQITYKRLLNGAHYMLIAGSEFKASSGRYAGNRSYLGNFSVIQKAR